MRRFLVPMTGFAMVSGLATLFIWGIVLTSPDTHAHLWDELRPEYDRTAPIAVGQGVVDVGLTLKRGRTLIGDPAALDPGREIYLAAGCATCHGLDARGGPVGPSLAGSFPEIVERMVREGRGGMPTYSKDHITEADLAKLSAYLQGIATTEPSVEELAALGRLTYDPLVSPKLALKGKTALRQSCGACHGQPTPEEIRAAFSTDAEAASLVAQMVRETTLGLEDARLIAHYMMAILHGADPVKEP